MTNSNVISLNRKLNGEINPDELLENYKGVFENLIMLGEDENGEYVFVSSTPDREKMLFILEQFKMVLLTAEF